MALARSSVGVRLDQFHGLSGLCGLCGLHRLHGLA